MTRSYSPDDERSFTITTVSGTVYKLSPPDSLGYRAIRRIMGRREKADAGSVVIKNNSDKLEPASKSFFKGKLLEAIRIDKPLIIEIFGEQRILMSEPVKEIKI